VQEAGLAKSKQKAKNLASMSPALRNILGLVAGLLAGWLVNMGLIVLSPYAIPPPAGVNPSDPESIAANIGLFEPKHFLFPFLAHALGTLAGAWAAAAVAATRKRIFAWIVGVLFLAGGIAAAFMIPAPAWFIALDLACAYLPMAWIGGRLATGSDRKAGR
jgi:hypothetical protein